MPKCKRNPCACRGGKRSTPCSPLPDTHLRLIHLQGETQLTDKPPGENVLLVLSSQLLYLIPVLMLARQI